MLVSLGCVAAVAEACSHCPRRGLVFWFCVSDQNLSWLSSPRQNPPPGDHWRNPDQVQPQAIPHNCKCGSKENVTSNKGIRRLICRQQRVSGITLRELTRNGCSAHGSLPCYRTASQSFPTDRLPAHGKGTDAESAE